jgi:hypothetical protein
MTDRFWKGWAAYGRPPVSRLRISGLREEFLNNLDRLSAA